jgi:hypothetical protein
MFLEEKKTKILIKKVELKNTTLIKTTIMSYKII